MIARTRVLFERGRPLCDLAGRDLQFGRSPGWGTGILDAIEAGDDVFTAGRGTRDRQARLVQRLALAGRA